MKKNTFRSPGRVARMILHIELPLIVLQAVVFFISYLIARETDLAAAIRVYPPLTEALLFPLLITAFSVLLAERLEK